MPPYSEAPAAVGIVHENAPPLSKSEDAIPDENSADYNQDVKWHNVIAIFVVHLMALYGIIACAPVIKFTTLIFRNYIFLSSTTWSESESKFLVLVFGTITAMGVTAGAHRLWTHRSYKAKLPLRIVLMLCFATSGQVIKLFRHVAIKFFMEQNISLHYNKCHLDSQCSTIDSFAVVRNRPLKISFFRSLTKTQGLCH